LLPHPVSDPIRKEAKGEDEDEEGGGVYGVMVHWPEEQAGSRVVS